ncbi:hypothetical protein N4R04_20565, partial [Salmonella enterica subsp. enterica serovar Pomona]
KESGLIHQADGLIHQADVKAARIKERTIRKNL